MVQGNNVTTASNIIRPDEAVQTYELGNFGNNEVNQTKEMFEVARFTDTNLPDPETPILDEIKKVNEHIAQLDQKITSLEQNGIQNRELDQQIVEALKDLKNYSAFFEQAAFQLESKILKTSLSIAKKIINIEVSANSADIAKETISNMMLKLKTASKVIIHLNPKDYIVLKDKLNFGETVSLQEDANVTPGGVVIASDLGNFDGNVESKVKTLVESLDTLI